MTGGRDGFLARHDVSRETTARLDRYAALLEKWSPRINLVSRASLPELWTRHFEDSAQILNLAPSPVAHWADLGSGGGFPALVVAALDAERPKIAAMTLVESDLRKATFLRTVIRELGLNARVMSDRIEQLPPVGAQVLSARALAPLSGLLSHANRHLAPGGVAFFPKGATYRAEMDAALETWRFRCETVPSMTDADAVILCVSEIERA